MNGGVNAAVKPGTAETKKELEEKDDDGETSKRESNQMNECDRYVRFVLIYTV